MEGIASKVKFWSNNWVGKPLIDMIMAGFVVANPDCLVSDF